MPFQNDADPSSVPDRAEGVPWVSGVSCGDDEGRHVRPSHLAAAHATGWHGAMEVKKKRIDVSEDFKRRGEETQRILRERIELHERRRAEREAREERPK
jgi:hypothetical protein